VIDPDAAATPNAQKIHILLEACALRCTRHWVDIGAGDPLEPGFRAISLDSRVPALFDRDGPRGRISLSELPRVKRWFERIAARPAVAEDMERLESVGGEWDEESRESSFGDRQRSR